NLEFDGRGGPVRVVRVAARVLRRHVAARTGGDGGRAGDRVADVARADGELRGVDELLAVRRELRRRGGLAGAGRAPCAGAGGGGGRGGPEAPGAAGAGEAAPRPAAAWPIAGSELLALLLAPPPEQPASAAIAMSVSPAGNATVMSLRLGVTLCVVRMPL